MFDARRIEMQKKMIAIVVLCFLVGCGITGCVSGDRATAVPDTSKAVALGHPDGATIKKLHGTLDDTKAEVIAKLGHPSKVSIVDGKEQWDYPWLAAAYVRFEKGVVVDTFYTAGY